MRSFLLLIAVSFVMTIGTLWPTHRENVPNITLPEVQITTKRTSTSLPEISLPPVTIRATKSKVTMIVLPEVVISADKFKKA